MIPKLQYYAIRIATEDMTKVQGFVETYSEKYLIAWEYTSPAHASAAYLQVPDICRQHCHIYIETLKSRQSMVKWIQRNIGKGNGCYSMKTLDCQRPIEYLAYCCKEGTLYTLKHNLPEETVTEAIEYDKKVKDELKKAKKEKASITSFKTISTWLENEDIYQHTPTGKRVDLKKLVRQVLRYYQEHSLFIREFHITSLCQTLLLKFDTNYCSHLVDKISERL